MASTLKIELNGSLILGRIDGVENFTVTYRRAQDTGTQQSSFSSELTFYDDGYDLIYTELISNVNGYNREVSVKIYDDCCGKAVFEGLIRGDSIDWCSDGCYVSANIIENDAALNCVQSTLIYDDHQGFIQAGPRPIIRYCIETRPDFISYVLILVTTVLQIVIFNILFILIGALLAIPIVGPVLVVLGLLFFYDDIKDAMKEIISLTVQCGRFHPGAYVRDYINNVCDKCGLTFRSSILNGDSEPYATWGNTYLNTVLVSAPVQKGKAKNNTLYTLIQKNLPNETLHTLMINYLQPMFNAEYKIANGILYFERKDYFVTTNNWIDFQQLLLNDKVHGNKVCWEWIDDDRYALADYTYNMDGVDWVGNEARDRWSDIVDWNTPVNPAQKGIKQVTLPSSCARFREDGIDTSVYDQMRTFLGGVVNNVVYAGVFNDYREVMLLPTHTFFNYKFLIYDTVQGSNGMVERNYASIPGNPDNTQPMQRFNYPYWFKEGYPNNLYTNFHYIDNPRLPGTTNFNFDFTFDFDCGAFDTFSFDKTVGGLNVNGQIKDGKINEIVVNFTNRTIKVTGIA